MAVTPLKRLRVDDDLWESFGKATEAMGSDRTKILVAFMRIYVQALSPEGVTRTASADHGRDSSP